MERGVDLRKTRENRKASKKALIAYTYVKLACDCNSRGVIGMNPKVATRLTIVLTLAIMLSANPVMIMSSNIFAKKKKKIVQMEVVQMGMIAHQKMNNQK